MYSASVTALTESRDSRTNCISASPLSCFISASVTGVGSGGDFAARLVAQGISANLAQQVVVDNRGINGIETVARASPARNYAGRFLPPPLSSTIAAPEPPSTGRASQ